jgi:aspartate kinase
VVAGFQGVDPHGNLTTLGRGGSDTSAVALAAALSADVCEIYTDVEGVYTADPRVCVSSRKLRSVSYEEMLELAALGAKVLHARSVEIAMKYKVPVHVRSTFSNETGTWIVDEERGLEARTLIGLACEPRQVRIELASAERGPELAARVMELLAARNVSADMMSHVCSPHDAARTEVVFTLPERDYLLVSEGLDQLGGKPGPHAPRVSRNHAKVSLVGIGIRSDPGVSARLCRALALRGIAVSALAMNELRISCLVDASLADEALRILHHEFDLAEEAAPPVLEKSA